MRLIPKTCRPLVLALAGLPVVASAHHSRVEYSDQDRDMEGEFVRVTWRNPHPTFTFKVTAEDGTEELVELQAWGSPYTLQRAGVGGERFTTGERVKIAARESTRREKQFVLTHTLFSDGTEVVLNLNEQPRWTDNSVGDRARYLASDDKLVIDAAGENRGIFRVWSSPARREIRVGTNFVLTEAAAATKAQYDPLSDFASQCEQPGMPRFMATPAAYEILDLGATITIQGAHYDPIRTIHMTDAEVPETQPADALGYSVGRWEDDALIVSTTRIDFPFFDINGTPLTGQAEVVERFTVSEDQTRLDYLAATTDPATFVGPATNQRYWIALGETVLPPYYERDCEPVD